MRNGHYDYKPSSVYSSAEYVEIENDDDNMLTNKEIFDLIINNNNHNDNIDDEDKNNEIKDEIIVNSKEAFDGLEKIKYYFEQSDS